MPIHVCQAVFEYPADVYLYISVNPRNIQEDGFSVGDLDGPRPRRRYKSPTNNARNFCAPALVPCKMQIPPSPFYLGLLPRYLYLPPSWLIDRLINYDSLLCMHCSAIRTARLVNYPRNILVAEETIGCARNPLFLWKALESIVDGILVSTRTCFVEPSINRVD